MLHPTPISTVGIVGAGVIGAAWAAHFLRAGLDVVAYDPADDAENRLRSAIDAHWPVLQRLGLMPGADPGRLVFVHSPQSVAEAAQYVQENGPERIEVKASLFRALDDAASPHTLLASSSSGLLATDIQMLCRHPERVLVAHPFNPVHMIPLVEVVGGTRTSVDTITRSLEFLTSTGKSPIHIRTEIKGHVANRLQAALLREAFHLLEIGVASAADIDTAISTGPGLRWALTGPFLNTHLLGGSGGITHALAHLGPPLQSWWDDLGSPVLTKELREKASIGVAAELAGRTDADVATQRDERLVELLELLSRSASSS